MKFSIITPSYNQLDYLKRCVASVADQQDVEVEHWVADGGSTDGTVEWLKSASSELSTDSYRLHFFSEADDGMYDALNKGFARASGDVCAWLNCDEQYLPGTLREVASFFGAFPAVDILFGGMLMVDPQGGFLACRKAMPMRRLFLEASYLYNFSCGMFIRKSFWDKIGGFNSEYHNAGDEELICRALRRRAKTAVYNRYLSVFTYSGENLSSNREALEEHEALKHAGVAAGRSFRLPINLLRLAEKAVRGGNVQKSPVVYEIYKDHQQKRCRVEVLRPVCRWPDAARPYLLSHRSK